MAMAFAVSAACSASSGKNEVPYTAGGSGGTPASGGSAGGGNVGGVGFGGTGGGVGGFGGSGNVAGCGGVGAQDGGCFGTQQEAQPQLQPADIIWAIDNSCSM